MRCKGEKTDREREEVIPLDNYRRVELLTLLEGLRLRLRRGRPDLDEAGIDRLCSRLVGELLFQFVDRKALDDYVAQHLAEGPGVLPPPAIFPPTAARF